MATAFQAKKIVRWFDVFDYDGNGTLELTDYQQAGLRYIQALGIQEHEAADLAKAIEAFWTDVLKPMDTDGDQGVSKEEMIAGFDHSVYGADNGYEATIKPVNDILFRLGDRNSDGRLGKSEFIQLMSDAMGLSRQEATAAFEAIDGNGKGYLTQDEHDRATRQYFLSDDPSLPGNLLYGALPTESPAQA